MKVASIFLMTGGQGGGQDPYSGLIMMGLIVVVFYFFFIRPQTKKNKDLKKFREGLKKGDRVITIGGIHGKILEVAETSVIIETEGQGRLKLNKEAVSNAGVMEDQIQK